MKRECAIGREDGERTVHKHAQKPIKQSTFFYTLTRIASFFVSKFIFKRQILRNELKGCKGPAVIIANHEAAYDFVNLIGLTRRKMTFVISRSFYQSLPIKGIIRRTGVIPKQQFQTNIRDIKAMKSVIEHGRLLMFYPAGLMCEDGLSTPIPQTTYKFLQWLGADVYMARSYGTYFAMPKWTSGMRSGKTYIDVYKLFTKEELLDIDESELKRRTDEAMLFDAYREQERFLVKYKNGSNIEGLENVLYVCPHCKREFTLAVRDKKVIYCTECGFAHESDDYGFLHNVGEGEEIRYVSDISKMAYETLRERVMADDRDEVVSVTLQQANHRSGRYEDVGCGTVTLTREKFYISGTVSGEAFEREISLLNFASLPFAPGKYFEIQHSDEIFRCIPQNPKHVVRFVNKVKIFHALAEKERETVTHTH